MAIPKTDNQVLNTLVTSAINTISANPANLVTEAGEKLMAKMAKRGRIFRVNDADRVEHPVMHNDDNTWATITGDNPGGTVTGLNSTQTEHLTSALFTILTRTKNFNIPQSMLGRDTRLAMSDIAYLAQRMAMQAYELEEAYILRGNSTRTGAYKLLAPFQHDTNWQAGDDTAGQMSLLGLLDLQGANEFGNISTDDNAQWGAYFQTAAEGNPADTAQFNTWLSEINECIVRADYGGMERPTDILTTVDVYMRFLEALRDKGTINDTLIRDMGASPDTEIPFGSVMVDYSKFLTADAVWDTGSGAIVSHPFIGLNLNSLRWNLVGQTTGVGEDAGWINQKSDLLPHPTASNFFKRLEYRFAWSLDNGRRSFFHLDAIDLA